MSAHFTVGIYMELILEFLEKCPTRVTIWGKLVENLTDHRIY